MGENEITTTVRCFELGYFMGRYGRKFRVKDVAEFAELSSSGAYRLLTRASGSRRVPMYHDEETGLWGVDLPDEETK